MNKVLMLLFCIALSITCNVKKGLIKRIDNHCGGSYPCEFIMSDIVKEDWDKMYIFKPSITLDFVEKKIGAPYPFFEDIAERVIFMKGRKIVYHEDQFPSIEEVYENEIAFVLPDKLEYKELTRSESKFVIRQLHIHNKSVFDIILEK